MRSLLPLVMILSLTPAAQAGESSPAPLEVDWAVDLPLTLAPAVVWLSANYLISGLPVLEEPPSWEPPGGIDGLATTTLNEDLALISDVGLYSLIALSATGTALVADSSHVDDHLLIFAEAISWTGVATELTKRAVDRPRPYTYGTGVTGDPDDALSFFSGHSSITSVSTFTLVRTLDLTHDLSTGQRWAAYGGAGLATAVVAGLRVAAGKHFPTDVLVGATVGTCAGLVVPTLHQSSHLNVSAGPGPDGGAQLTVAGSF